MRRAAFGRALALAAALAAVAAPAVLAADWPLPNGDLASTRAATGSRITPGSVGRLVERWRYRIRGEGTDFGRLTATPVVVGDDRLPPDVEVGRRRARPPHGPRAVVARHDGAERRAERRRRRRRTGLRSDRHDRVRARRPHGQGSLDATPREQDRAVRRHRPRRRSRSRLLRDRRLPARRAWRRLRARRADGTSRSGSSTRSRSPGRTSTPAGAGRGTRCRSTRRAASTSASRTPGPWGGTPRYPNGGWFRRQHALHGLARRARRRHRQGRLVRPGARPRRPRLRLPRLARSSRRSAPDRSADGVRRRQGRPGDRLGPRDARAGLGAAGRDGT